MDIKRKIDRRDIHVHVRLTAEEKEMLAAAMKMSGATITEVVVAGIREVYKRLAQEQEQ